MESWFAIYQAVNWPYLWNATIYKADFTQARYTPGASSKL